MFIASFRRLPRPARRRPVRGCRPCGHRHLLGLEVLEGRVLPSTIQWVNPAGGDWDTPGNWQDATTGQNRLPTASDDAVIATSGITVTHALDGVADAVHSLTSQAALSLSAGSLTVGSTSTLGSTLDLFGGTFGGAGDVTVQGLFTWSTGTMSGSGRTIAGGGLHISGINSKILDGRTLVNAGSATWTDGGSLDVRNGATIDNKAGATFDVQGDSVFSGSGTFTNEGTFTKSAGTGNTDLNSITFNNTGTLDVKSGTVTLNGGGASSGVFTAGAGAALAVGGGSPGAYTLQKGASESGAGDFLVANGGTLTASAAVTVQNLSLGEGTLNGSGTVTVAGLLNWSSGGTMSGSGQTVAAGRLQLSNTIFQNIVLDGRTLINAGSATWTGGGNLATGDGAVIDNRAGATFDVQGDSTLGLLNGSTADATFTNEGTLTKSAGAGTFHFSGVVFNNPGRLEVESGTVALEDGGTGTGAFAAGAGATLEFDIASYTLTASSSVVGAGTVAFNDGGATSVGGIYGVSGTTEVAGTAVFNGAASTGALSLEGGTLTGAGTVTVTGLLSWSGGTMSGSGRTVAGGGLQFPGFSILTLDGRTLVNGTHAAQAVGLILSNGARIINQAGATWDITGGVTIDQSAGTAPGLFSNGGTLKMSAAGITALNVPLNNGPTGTVVAQAGTLTLAAGGTSNGAFWASAGAVLGFEGGPYTEGVGATIGAEGTVNFSDAGTASAAQVLEVASQDLGLTAAGFQRNSAYARLELASSFVRLDDAIRTTPAHLALYVDTLVVNRGSTLDLNGLHVYARAAQISGTVLKGLVTLVPSGGPLSVGGAQAGSLDVSGQTDEWTFFGRAGGAESVVVSSGGAGTHVPTPPTLDYAQVSVLAPDGSLLARGSNTRAGADVVLPGISLPVDGTYKVRVAAAPDHAGSFGHYTITAYDATAQEATLRPNEALTGVLDNPYRVDRWTFTARANTQVRLDVLDTSDPAVQFTLIGPDGNAVFSGQSGGTGQLTLPLDGAYALTVSTGDGTTGGYAFRLEENVATDLTLGTPFSGTLLGGGEVQLFRVHVPQSELLVLDLGDGAGTDLSNVYVKFGAPPALSEYQYGSSAPGATQRVLVPAAAPGDWYVLVDSESVAHAGSPFTLTASTASLVVSGVTPDSAAVGMLFPPPPKLTVGAAPGDPPVAIPLTVTGGGFLPGTTVQLVAGDGTAYQPIRLEIATPEQMTAVFGAGSLPVGVYTVVVTQPGGARVSLPGAFRATEAEYPGVQYNLVTPPDVGRHQPATLYLQYSNPTDIVMGAPLVVVHASQNAFLSLDPTQENVAFFTTAQPPGFSDTVEFLAGGSSPGLLGPGETGQVPIYYAGLKQPSDLNNNQVEFDVSVLYPWDIPWSPTSIDWDSEKDSLRPPGVSAEAWNAVFANLVALTGNTTGHYVSALDDNAQYLGTLGENVTDVNQLWVLQVQRAIGFSPITNLGDSTDAQVSEPGLTLELGRAFVPSLVGRYQLGVLGRGWVLSDGWDRVLSVAPDGSVTITAGDGSQRSFAPDLRGGYFDQPGGYGVLTALTGGGFTLRESDGQVTGFRPDGRVDYVQDTNGNRVTAGYTNGLMTSLTASSGDALLLAYNDAGRLISVTDPAGRTTHYFYDAGNEHLTAVVDPYGRTTTYTYDVSGNPATRNALLSIAYPDGTHDDFDYDALGRFADTHKDNNAQRVIYAYGPDGSVQATAAAGGTTTLDFDARGLVAKVEDALHSYVLLGYDANFNLTRVTDATGKTYSYAYDANGNLTRITDPAQDVTQFAYSGPFNRLVAVTDARGNTTRYGTDGRGNLVGITYADNTAEYLNENAAGEPVTQINPTGDPIRYTYDANGRLRTKTYSDGSQITYGYDARGNLTTATDGSGTTTLTYDAKDELIQVTYPDGRFLRYTYDAAGRRTSMVDQDGFTTNYNYDSVGRLAGLTDATGASVVRYTYDAAGRLSREDKGNGTYTTYGYDADGQVLHLVNYALDGTVNSRFDYTYDLLGKVQTMATLDGVWTYTYDALGQLTHAVFASKNPSAVPDQDLRYAYDAVGNRTQTILNGVTTSYTTNTLNEYTQVGGDAYAYDADGNLTSIRRVDGTAEVYTYNPDNRPSEVATPTEKLAYQYDAFGNLAATIQNGRLTQYLVDPFGLGNVVAEYDQKGNVVAHYEQGLGLVTTVGPDKLPAYYDFDSLGNTAALTGARGQLLSTDQYDPFGDLIANATPVGNGFLFGGESGDSEGNTTVWMRARSYSPALGRFLSPDPLGIAAGDGNYYRYAFNSPTNLIDPSGLYVGNVVVGFGPLAPGSNGFSFVASDGTGVIGISAYSSHGASIYWHELAHLEYTQTFGAPDTLNNFFNNEIIASRAGAEAARINHDSGYEQEQLRKANILATFGLNSTLGQAYFQRWVTSGANHDLLPLLPGTQQLVGLARLVGARDPNALTGPAGFGDPHFVAGGATLPYRIDFENEPGASAPAQRVEVVEHLDPGLDPSTFALAEIGFGDTNLILLPGTRQYRTTVPVTYNGHAFVVAIDAGLRPSDGALDVVFQSLDPATGLPPDVLTGFLPPEDGTGRGLGHVSFTVRPRAGLATGTPLRGVADVTFDLGQAIATDQVDDHDPAKGTDPAKEAPVTIDSGTPTSSVSPLPTVESSPTFTVRWGGQDDPGGSGIASYDIYVSDNGGPFVPALLGTARTFGNFTGVNGHTYAFYSVATDNVRNRQATPAVAQATTAVQLPPVLPSTPGRIGGTVFLDYNADGVQNGADPGLPGRAVYLDLNGNGVPDPGEPATTTDGGGHYLFTGIAPGTYTLRERLDPGVLLTRPLAGSYVITVSAGVDLTGLDFGNRINSPALPLLATQSVFAGPNPDPLTAAIRGLYRSTLGRDPGGLETQFWLGRMLLGESLTGVAADIWQSPEHLGLEVDGYYRTVLHREADPAGRAFWVRMLLSGVDEATVFQTFLTSPEYMQAHAGADAWVRGLYRDVLGRDGDDPGVGFWTVLLGGGFDPAAVARDFIFSGESEARVIDSLFAQYLGRPADSLGMDFWMNRLRRGPTSLAAVAVGIMGSDEFLAGAGATVA